MNDKKKQTTGSVFNNIFGKKPKVDQKIPFDENYFELTVEGGPVHSNLIKVKAIARNNKEELKLKCTWFLISPNHDVISLSTVSD